MKLSKISNRKLNITLLLISIIVLTIPSTIVCRISALILACICVIWGTKEKKFVNPFFLFAFTPLSLAMYVNLGGRLMVDLSYETWRLALINMIAFIVALRSTKSFRSTSNCISLSSKNALVLSAVVFYALSMVGNFVPEIQALTWFSFIGSIVCLIKTKSKVMYAFCLVILFTRVFIGASKMDILMSCITVLVCYDKFFVSTPEQRKKILLYSIGGLAFMLFAFSFANKERGNYDAKEGLDYYQTYNQVEWNADASLFLPYMYFETPWVNLQFVTETQQQSTHGLWMAKPILGYVGKAKQFEKEYDLIPYSSFNTFTFVTVAYKDFGYWLSVIMSFFLGWFVKKVYTRFVMSKSPFDITAYILTGLATAEMFFSNHFFMQSYPFTCLIMMEFWKYLARIGGGQVELDYENIDK